MSRCGCVCVSCCCCCCCWCGWRWRWRHVVDVMQLVMWTTNWWSVNRCTCREWRWCEQRREEWGEMEVNMEVASIDCTQLAEYECVDVCWTASLREWHEDDYDWVNRRRNSVERGGGWSCCSYEGEVKLCECEWGWEWTWMCSRCNPQKQIEITNERVNEWAPKL